MDILDQCRFSCGDMLECTRTYGANLRAQYRNGYDGHDLAAGCRLHKLYVRSLRVIDDLGGVTGAAGFRACRKAVGKITAVGGAAHEHGRGLILPAEHIVEAGIGLSVVALIAALGYLFIFAFGQSLRTSQQCSRATE